MRLRLLKILVGFCPLAVGACALLPPAPTAPPQPVDSAAASNRPDGEGYAGRGELVVRIAVAAHTGKPVQDALPSTHKKPDQAMVELRYLGLDGLSRAVFERRDVDVLAGPALPIQPAALVYDASGQPDAANLPPDTRLIVVDLRLARQIHIQGKIIEVLEATPSGVVFRQY